MSRGKNKNNLINKPARASQLNTLVYPDDSKFVRVEESNTQGYKKLLRRFETVEQAFNYMKGLPDKPMIYYDIHAKSKHWLEYNKLYPFEQCGCFGSFSGKVTSVNPIKVNCMTTGDDSIVIISQRKDEFVGYNLYVQNDKTLAAESSEDESRLDEIQVGDWAFNLQTDCVAHEHLARLHNPYGEE